MTTMSILTLSRCGQNTNPRCRPSWRRNKRRMKWSTTTIEKIYDLFSIWEHWFIFSVFVEDFVRDKLIIFVVVVGLVHVRVTRRLIVVVWLITNASFFGIEIYAQVRCVLVHDWTETTRTRHLTQDDLVFHDFVSLSELLQAIAQTEVLQCVRWKILSFNKKNTY